MKTLTSELLNSDPTHQELFSVLSSENKKLHRPISFTENSFENKKLTKIDKAYSSEPWWYDLRGFLILTFAYRSTLPAQIRLFSKNMGQKHLEAAIGTGTLFEMILKWRRWKKMKHSQTIGFDYADRMLAGARKRFQKESSVELLKADIAQLPFPENVFDTANIANSIHCLPEIKSGIQELYRVLKLNGTLAGNVLISPRTNGIMDRLARWINSWGMKKGILHRPYQIIEVKDIIQKAGFEIITEKSGGNCFEFIARKVSIAS